METKTKNQLCRRELQEPRRLIELDTMALLIFLRNWRPILIDNDRNRFYFIVLFRVISNSEDDFMIFGGFFCSLFP